MTRRTTRDQRAHPAHPAPIPFTVTCTGCGAEHHSPDPGLPENWRIIVGGVRCPDCAPPAKKAQAHG